MLCLHTSPLMQPGQGDAGGMNVYVRHLTESLVASGHAVDLITLWRAAEHPGHTPPVAPVNVAELEPGLRLITVTLPNTTHAGKDDLARAIPTVAAALAEATAQGLLAAPDVLHGHYWLSAAAARALADRWRIPLVATFHTTARAKNTRAGAGEHDEPAVREIGEAQIIDSAQAVVVNTAAESADLQRLYAAAPEKLHVIAPGVDLGVFHPGAEPLSEPKSSLASERPFTIGFAGRLQPLKGPQILVEAVARMRCAADPLDVRLWLAGVGQREFTHMLHGRLKDLELELDLELTESVEFAGSLPVTELAQRFRDADVVAVPSSSETFGLVALEAQACGTPVVATAVDGLHVAVEDGQTGWLVPDRSPLTWAGVLREIAADPAEVRRRGERAAQRARQFSWAANAQTHTELYRSLTRP